MERNRRLRDGNGPLGEGNGPPGEGNDPLEQGNDPLGEGNNPLGEGNLRLREGNGSLRDEESRRWRRRSHAAVAVYPLATIPDAPGSGNFTRPTRWDALPKRRSSHPTSEPTLLAQLGERHVDRRCPHSLHTCPREPR